MAQVFQTHQAQLTQKVGNDRAEMGIRSVSVKNTTTFYNKPVPQDFIIMQPVPSRLVTVMVEMENGKTMWLNLKMGYAPFWGMRHLCGQDID